MQKTKTKPGTMGRPMTRQLRAGEPIMVSFKLDGAIVRQLDDVAKEWMRERPGTSATRSEVARNAIIQWLESRATRKV